MFLWLPTLGIALLDALVAEPCRCVSFIALLEALADSMSLSYGKLMT